MNKSSLSTLILVMKMFERGVVERYRAGADLIQLLVDSGYHIRNADIDVGEPFDHNFSIEAEVAVEKEEDPLETFRSLEARAESDNRFGFSLGLMFGLMLAGASGDCSKEDCPRGE